MRAASGAVMVQSAPGAAATEPAAADDAFDRLRGQLRHADGGGGGRLDLFDRDDCRSRDDQRSGGKRCGSKAEPSFECRPDGALEIRERDLIVEARLQGVAGGPRAPPGSSGCRAGSPVWPAR